jgi:GT2 family glycosyltransferase
MATHANESWFNSVVEALAAQDYPNLHVTFVHGPGEGAFLERWNDRLPQVETLEVAATAGFGDRINAAVEQATEPVVLICHDDVAFEDGAISALVREWIRRADPTALIAPKLVSWNDPTRLVPSGFDADRFGETLALVKPGDLDQGQQDRVAEVFGVSSACVLMGREFFQKLGGFDEAMDWHGEAHDLSVRARASGATIVIAASSTVRHRASFAERGGADETLRARRHHMRSALTTASGFGLVRLILSFMVLHLVEFSVALARLDLAELRAIPGAWLWNIANLGSLLSRRRQLAEHRTLTDEQLQGLRRKGSIRLSESIDRRITQREVASERGETTVSAVRAAGVSILVLLLVFGARHLLTRGIPSVGEFRVLPEDLGTLSGDWWSGWRTQGMGSEGFAPFAYPLLDVAGALTLGAESFLRMLMLVLPLPLGVLGMWRLFNRTDSDRAPVAAAFLYAASPVPYNAISGGSFGALILFAALPWMLGHIIGVSSSVVFKRPGRRSVSVVGLLTLLTVVGAFLPWVGVTFALLVAGLVLGSFLAGDMRGVPALLGVAALALAGAALLNLPHLVELTTWTNFGTAQTSTGSVTTLIELLTQTTGPIGSTILGWAVFAPALLPLVSGRGQRFTWGMRIWGVLLVAWAVAWAAARGWLPMGVPVNEILLAPVALGLAVLGGLAAMVVDIDLVGARARALIPAVLAVVGFAFAMLPLADGSFTGRWELARVDLTNAYGAIEAPPEEGSYRVLWIGDAHVLGAAATPTANDLAWTSSLDGAPDIRALWPAAPGAADDVLTEAITAGLDGRTSRLGRELARFGVRYLVVMDQQAPVPEPSRRVPVSDARAAGFASQLDLVRTGVVNPAVVVYENTAWVPVHAAVAPAALDNLRLDDPAPVATNRDGHDVWTGQVRVTRNVYAAWAPSPRWTLQLGNQVMPRIDVGSVGMGFETAAVEDVSDAVFAYDTSETHRLILGAQLFGWTLLIFLRRWIVGRERREVRLVESRAERA